MYVFFFFFFLKTGFRQNMIDPRRSLDGSWEHYKKSGDLSIIFMSGITNKLGRKGLKIDVDFFVLFCNMLCTRSISSLLM